MSGLNEMKKRIMYAGGNSDGRNVKGKLKSMQSALWNSYQAEWIQIDKRKKQIPYRCLINAEKMTTDYSQKIISIEFLANMKPGDTFLWNRTGKHWLVYNSFEEEAYFRARIRKCEYELDINGEKYWVWLRGPVETAIVERQKHQIETNDMNYSLLVWITDDENTRDFIERFKIMKFDNHRWRVAAVDRYSQEGIIEFTLEEWFDNELEEAYEAEQANLPEIVKEDVGDPFIQGPETLEAFAQDVTYALCNTTSTGVFTVNSSKVKITYATPISCTLQVLTGKAISFTLTYKGDDGLELEIPVTVKSF